MNLGQRIEERRQQLGISQAELARRVGVRQSTMNSLINGESRTSRSILKIARELNTTPAYLIGETDDPASDAPIARPMSSIARELLDYFDTLPDDEQRAVMQITRGLACRKELVEPVTLPSTAALADAMSAFLEASPGLAGDELAHELAMSLPIILRGAADEIIAPHSDQRDTDPAPRAIEHAGRRAARPGQRN